MKTILSILLIAAIIVGLKLRSNDSRTPAGEGSSENLQCLFSKPLIIGASISAGYGVQNGGPGSVLSRLINEDAQIDERAVSGASSVQVLSSLELTTPYPSVVIGFDLFFWDAVKNQCGEEFEKSTRKFFAELKDLGIPAIIGRVPTNVKFPAGIRLAGMRACTKTVNDLVTELCEDNKNCVLFDPKDCLNAMGTSANAEGVSYFNDKLHTSDEGNRFCAEYFHQQGSYRRLKCMQDDL